MKITKREILASVSIIGIMLLIGSWISGLITDSQIKHNTIYNKAMKINDKELFEYGMRTDVGLAFVYGELKAVDPVTYPEIDGKYIYLRKVKEKYTEHTKRVWTGKTWVTRSEWTWDTVHTESQHSKIISFKDVQFPYGKIDIPGTEYITTLYETSKIRYVYYGSALVHIGTIFTYLGNNTVSDNTPFHNTLTIDQTLKQYYMNGWEYIFWIFWILLTAGIVYLFYKMENKWLE